MGSVGPPASFSPLRRPLATPEETAAEPAPFPIPTPDAPYESGFPDWRRRLERNLSRRSVSRWEPLTHTHAEEGRRARPGTGQIRDDPEREGA
jgi:hypothetical protein